jgi:serine/threonine protein kinase
MLRINKYKCVGKITSGAFGTIELYTSNIDDKEYVVKKMSTDDNMNHMSSVVREIEIYKKLKHPHVMNHISYKYATDTMLMLDRGKCALSDFIGPTGEYTSELAYKWIHEVSLGLSYLHKLNIIHADLKPANVIMFRDANNNFISKLGDFGCCQIYIPNKKMNSYIQTEYYRSPEIKSYVDKRQYSGLYNKKIDLWSLGVLIVDMVCKKYSFNSFNYYGKDHLSKLKPYINTHAKINVYEEVIYMVDNLLLHDPNERWSICDFLNHDYWSKKNYSPFDDSSFQYETKMNFKYPISDSYMYDNLVEYYKNIPGNIVDDGYFYALKIQPKVKSICFLRLFQYCIYIISLLHYDECHNDIYRSIMCFKKQELFRVLNATNFVLF